MRALITALIATIAVASHGGPLQAAPEQTTPCLSADNDWVLVSIDVHDETQWAGRLLNRLRVEMAPNHIEICPVDNGAARPPLARVHIARAVAHQVAIEVQVDDAVTDKRVVRQLDLSGMPPDTHALTIALGVTELLRASWAEVTLRHSAMSQRDVPSSVRHSVDSYAMHSPAMAMLGLHVAGEEFLRGMRQVGADARLELRIKGPWHGTMQFGMRQSPSIDTADGTVRLQTFRAGLGPALTLTPLESSTRLAVLARLDWEHVQILAEPKPGALAGSGGTSVYLSSVGLFAGVALKSSIELAFEVDAGTVIKGVRAFDGPREVVAMNGAWVGISTGLGVLLW